MFRRSLLKWRDNRQSPQAVSFLQEGSGLYEQEGHLPDHSNTTYQRRTCGFYHDSSSGPTSLEYGIDPEGMDADGVTPLHRAARQGKTDIVRQLINNGVPLEARMHQIDGSTDRSLGTPLHWAAIEGHLGATIALVDAGAQVDARNAWRRTPLHCAARFGHLDVVKLLVARGANIEARRDTNETPLHFAIEGRSNPVAIFLIEAGADINAMGDRGTPLQFAYSNRDYQLAQFIMSRGGKT